MTNVIWAWRLGISKLRGKIGIPKCPECGSFRCRDASPEREWRTFFRCNKLRHDIRKLVKDPVTKRDKEITVTDTCNHYFVTRTPRHHK